MADRLLRALIRVMPAALEIGEEFVGGDQRPDQPVTTIEAAIQRLRRRLTGVVGSREQQQIADWLVRVQVAVAQQWVPLCAIDKEISTLLDRQGGFRLALVDAQREAAAQREAGRSG
jgi:hypothetical protein